MFFSRRIGFYWIWIVDWGDQPNRIEAFVKWFVKDHMENLSEEEFVETVETLIKMKSLRM